MKAQCGCLGQALHLESKACTHWTDQIICSTSFGVDYDAYDLQDLRCVFRLGSAWHGSLLRTCLAGYDLHDLHDTDLALLHNLS